MLEDDGGVGEDDLFALFAAAGAVDALVKGFDGLEFGFFEDVI